MDELIARLEKQFEDAKAKNAYAVAITPGDLHLILAVLKSAADFAYTLPRQSQT